MNVGDWFLESRWAPRIAATAYLAAVVLLVGCPGQSPKIQDSPGARQESKQGTVDVGNKRSEDSSQKTRISDDDPSQAGHHNIMFVFTGDQAAMGGAAIAALALGALLAIRRYRRAESSLVPMIQAVGDMEANGGAEAAVQFKRAVAKRAAQGAPIHKYVKKVEKQRGRV